MYNQPKFEGKTKHEERVLPILKDGIRDYGNKIELIHIKQRELEDKIPKLRKDQFKLEMKVSAIEDRIRKRCKHDKYPRQYWKNCRDDASFDRYCGCSNCGETIWDECK
ncbi:hypothetical protein LCGC14_1005860 [marine sediment metagenome]|uniref:Uncharacterized protein n=1 Tax=marine sediment metagenome TaxID=412755 RepID=A0A0F9NN53_9ZZZZ